MGYDAYASYPSSKTIVTHFFVCLSIYVSNAIINPPKRNSSDRT